MSSSVGKQRGTAGAGAASSTAAKVAFLARPQAYPDLPRRVRPIESRMSWVFLTDGDAYKLKKPVHHAFLDFSTLAARRRCAEAEVLLNRRLAPDVYRGVVPLTLDRRGALHLGGDGQVVDWLVWMRRLPAARSLVAGIRRGWVGKREVRELAAILAGFFRRCPPAELAPPAYLHRLREDVEANRRELSAPAGGLSPQAVASVHDAQLGFLRSHADALGARVDAGWVREGHGDLRPEHVFFLPTGPVVIDCVEYNRAFRTVDVADELAFLALQCEFLGARTVGDAILASCSRELGDAPSRGLLSFHKSRRACLRSKIALWHLADPQIRARRRWRHQANRYLELAVEHARALAAARRSEREQLLDRAL